MVSNSERVGTVPHKLHLESSWLRLQVGLVVVCSSSLIVFGKQTAERPHPPSDWIRSGSRILRILILFSPLISFWFSHLLNTNHVIHCFILQKEVCSKEDPCSLPSFGEEFSEDYLDETVLNDRGKYATIRVLFVAKRLLAMKWVIIFLALFHLVTSSPPLFSSHPISQSTTTHLENLLLFTAVDSR